MSTNKTTALLNAGLFYAHVVTTSTYYTKRQERTKIGQYATTTPPHQCIGQGNAATHAHVRGRVAHA